MMMSLHVFVHTGRRMIHQGGSGCDAIPNGPINNNGEILALVMDYERLQFFGCPSLIIPQLLLFDSFALSEYAAPL